MGLFVQFCVRKRVWSRPCCPTASRWPSSSACCGNWIREELFRCGPRRTGSQSITGVNTHTSSLNRESESEWISDMLQICPSKAIYQRKTQALLQRSFRTFQTTQGDLWFRQSYRQHAHTHTDTHSSQYTHHCCFHYTHTQTHTVTQIDDCLSCNGIAVTQLASCREARLKVSQYRKLTEGLSPVETSWYQCNCDLWSKWSCKIRGILNVV